MSSACQSDVETSSGHPTINRWVIVFGGVLVQLCLGAIYAWSAFTKVLEAEPYGFSKTQTQVVFAAGLVSFAVVMALVAGRWQARVGPRVVSIAGGLVMGAGYLIGAASGTSFFGIMIGIGVVGGAGIGLAYVCPIAALVKWFPERKGMITGIAVAGFGFGALFWVKLTTGFKFGSVDLTPNWDGLFGAGLSPNQVFALYGVAFATLVSLGSLALVNPPAGWSPGGYMAHRSRTEPSEGDVDCAVAEMVRTRQFWSVFLIFTFGAMAGLMVIGIIKQFGMDRLTSGGTELDRANIITGTAMGLFLALFNGLGRILWGTISDGLGRRYSIALMSLLQGLTMFAFYAVGRLEWGMYIGAAMIGFNFGGNFALFPAVTADLFGNRAVGTNYPWVFLAYGVGGIAGPILGGFMGDAQAWLWAFVPAGGLCVLGAAIALTLTPLGAAHRHSDTAPVPLAPARREGAKAA